MLGLGPVGGANVGGSATNMSAPDAASNWSGEIAGVILGGEVGKPTTGGVRRPTAQTRSAIARFYVGLAMKARVTSVVVEFGGARRGGGRLRIHAR